MLSQVRRKVRGWKGWGKGSRDGEIDGKMEKKVDYGWMPGGLDGVMSRRMDMNIIGCLKKWIVKGWMEGWEHGWMMGCWSIGRQKVSIIEQMFSGICDCLIVDGDVEGKEQWVELGRETGDSMEVERWLWTMGRWSDEEIDVCFFGWMDG